MKLSLTILICVHSTNDFYDDLLKKSLISLVNQTYKNFKTLIVLDECWEKTEKVIDNFLKKLDLTILKKNKKEGLSFAKNLGLQKIDTEWVGFIDGDDLYVSNKLEKQINYILNNSVDFLGTHSWNINKNDDENLFPSCFDVNENISHNEIQNKIYNENVLTHGSMLIRKKCIDELMGYRNIKGMEDWDLWKRAIKAEYKFYQLPDRLYIYRLGTSIIR
jgi:glycosyltransferase involved in cell wall biosynthesis